MIFEQTDVQTHVTGEGSEISGVDGAGIHSFHVTLPPAIGGKKALTDINRGILKEAQNHILAVLIVHLLL